MSSRLATSDHPDGCWRAAPDARAVATPEGTVLLSLGSGRYFALNPTGAWLWNRLRAGASSPDLAAHLAARFPEVDPGLLRTDAEALLHALRRLGLIVAVAPGAAEDTPGPAVVTAVPIDAPLPPSPFADAVARARAAGPRSLARVSLAWGLLLLTDLGLAMLGFASFHRLVRRWPTRGRRGRAPQGEAEAARIGRLCAALDRASRGYFKRAWCLQRAAATTLLLRLCGVPAQLVIGVRTLPFLAHAWVEVAGEVVNDRRRVRVFYTALERC